MQLKGVFLGDVGVFGRDHASLGLIPDGALPRRCRPPKMHDSRGH
jgi:hypothetical protein